MWTEGWTDDASGKEKLLLEMVSRREGKAREHLVVERFVGTVFYVVCQLVIDVPMLSLIRL